MADLRQLLDEVLAFRDERDWAQCHTPRHLAAALAIEAAEIQELLLRKGGHGVLYPIAFRCRVRMT